MCVCYTESNIIFVANNQRHKSGYIKTTRSKIAWNLLKLESIKYPSLSFSWSSAADFPKIQ